MSSDGFNFPCLKDIKTEVGTILYFLHRNSKERDFKRLTLPLIPSRKREGNLKIKPFMSLINKEYWKIFYRLPSPQSPPAEREARITSSPIQCGEGLRRGLPLSPIFEIISIEENPNNGLTKESFSTQSFVIMSFL